SPEGRVASGRVWVTILALCAAQYFTVKEQALDLHFYNASVLLMVTTFLVLWALLPRDAHGDLLLPALLFRGLEAEGAGTGGAASDLVELVRDSERPGEETPLEAVAPSEGESAQQGETSAAEA